MSDKFGPVGITFDDVLLEAPLQRSRAGRGRRHHPARRPTSRLNLPLLKSADEHGHRVETWPSPWLRKGAWA